MTLRQHTAAYWAELDWVLSNRELQKQTGCSFSHVTMMRRKLAPQTRSPTRTDRIVAGADWQMDNGQLAAQYGVSYGVISKLRLRCAPSTYHMRLKDRAAQAANRQQWAGWDWSKRDVELARQHHLSRERIRQIRGLVGADKTICEKTTPTACHLARVG